MTRRSARLAVFVALVFVPPGIARAGTVHGTVHNGTTGQTAAGIELALLQPMSGMQEVAHSKSGAQGEFTFDNPGLGTQPMLVQANYHGIHFNQMVPPGRSTVQVDIFEPTRDPKTINVPSHVVIFQPNGSTLIVGEEYQIENKSQPPQAYFRTDGSFDFVLPENGQLQQVAATGSAGMPVTQLPIDKKKNRYSIAYAFRPGDSSVRFSYELPYAGNTATVKLPTVYPGGRLLVVAPPTVQVTGDGLAPGGQEQGMNLYGRQDVPAGALVTVNLSGTAPPPSEASTGAEQGPQGRDAQQAGAESSGVRVQPVPPRLEGYLPKWMLILSLVAGFAFLAFLLWSKKVIAVPIGSPDGPSDKPVTAKAPSQSRPQKSVSDPASVAAPGRTPTNGSSSLADVDAAIGTSLDALKERLFRLELRRQAGTISEDEYVQERARAEKVLRDLVRG
ncbi:MAG TPA: hypothetical protein VFN26_12430 [Candidatus Acidoferrum sp.]|nr:hypothetical protein [Candidatus Acidoferrum sp.]